MTDLHKVSTALDFSRTKGVAKLNWKVGWKWKTGKGYHNDGPENNSSCFPSVVGEERVMLTEPRTTPIHSEK